MNNQAPELSPEARRLINEARGADDPTADDQARVKARWLASVAAVAGVSSLTEAARAAGGIGWGFKAVGAALVIAAGAIGLNFVLDADDPAQATKTAPLPGWSGSSPERFQKTPRVRTEPTSIEPNSIEPNRAAPSAVALEPAPAVPSEVGEAPQPLVAAESAESPVAAEGGELGVDVPQPAAVSPSVAQPGVAQPRVSQPSVSPAQAAVRRGAVRAKPNARASVARAEALKGVEPTNETGGAAAVPATSAAAGPSGQLSEELAVLSDVRRNIQEGAAARAIEVLDRYESRFGQPILGMEADALRVDALCKAGQRDAARERARVFQKEWPGSPLERRVSAACP